MYFIYLYEYYRLEVNIAKIKRSVYGSKVQVLSK